MMKRFFRYLSFSLLPMVAALAACQRLESVAEAPEISFSVGSVIATKATPYSAETDLRSKSIGLFAYTYVTASPATKTRCFVNRPLGYNESAGCWLPTDSNPMTWPNDPDKTIQFYAYAPKDAASASSDVNVLPTLTYTVPAEVADQRGLLVAGPVENCSAPLLSELRVPLSFRHILFGLRFLSDEPIRSITVSGVYGSGVYDMGTSAWTPMGDPEKEYSISGSPLVLDGIDVSKTMMLLPQQPVPAGATVTIWFNDELSAREPFSISGQNWLPGRQITYVIQRSEVYILYGTFAEDVLWVEDGEW